MNCRVTDLRCKEVVNIRTGCRLGCVDDVEVDTQTAKVLGLVVFGRLKCFGLLGRKKDCYIRWCDIEVIGEDTILICRHFERKHGEKCGCPGRGFFG